MARRNKRANDAQIWTRKSKRADKWSAVAGAPGLSPVPKPLPVRNSFERGDSK